MRITVLCVGSFGDVLPFVAFGVRLQQAGHRVRVATHPIFQAFISSYGLDFFPVGGNPKEILQAEAGQSLMESGQLITSFVRFVGMCLPQAETLLADCWRACQQSEAIVYSTMAMAGYHIAEKLGVPCYAASVNPPMSPTRAYPSVYLPKLPFNLDSNYNWLTHIVVEQAFWQPFRSVINQWRQETLNLPPLPLAGPYMQQHEQKVPFLYGYSPSVFPRPSDWGNWLHITGYWFLDRPTDWQPPAKLVEFIAAGPPPVYIGFGSMTIPDPESLTKLVLKALAQSGQRGILLRGWGGLSNADLPDDVFAVESVPHDWLFPQMAAVVHHGGAGTTAAALRAGIPSVIIPFFLDQFYWGQRVAELGAGTPPIPYKQLSVEKLATAISTTVNNKIIRTNANALGREIQSENGVAQAVKAFHNHLSVYNTLS